MPCTLDGFYSVVTEVYSIKRKLFLTSMRNKEDIGFIMMFFYGIPMF